jgi:LPXTG-site transpeptidase (sortase) family protein
MKFTSRAFRSSFLCIGLGLTACGAQSDAGSEIAAPNEPSTAAVSEAVESDSGSQAEQQVAPTEKSIPGLAPEPAADELSPLSSQVIQLESAFPERVLEGLGDPIGFQPEKISLPSLGVDEAEIVPVGLEDNGELEVPGANGVGWYQFGAGIEGGRGSTVLATHIAYNGRDRVFRDLADTNIGEQIVVERDGQDVVYLADSVTQYGKWDLPSDDLLSENSEERLVLITCGGSFNPSLRSYDDNVVVVATRL